MTDSNGRPNHIMDVLAQMHPGGWYGWKKTEDNGDKIPGADRMQYKYILIHPKIWNSENQALEDNPYSKPTEQECIDGLVALQTDYDDAKTKLASDKTSGSNKLKVLGLTDSEITAIPKG